jgi:hypothetical protein
MFFTLTKEQFFPEFDWSIDLHQLFLIGIGFFLGFSTDPNKTKIISPFSRHNSPLQRNYFCTFAWAVPSFSRSAMPAGGKVPLL